MDTLKFAEKYGVCLHPSEGIKLINLNLFQKMILNNLDDERLPKTIIDSTRQSGISTTLAVYIARFLIFHKGEKNTILIKSVNANSSKYLLQKVRLILERFYGNNEDCFPTNNVSNVKLINDNEVKIIASAENLRGQPLENIHSLVIDNAKFIPKLDEWIDDFTKQIDVVKLIIASTDEVEESNIANTFKQK